MNYVETEEDVLLSSDQAANLAQPMRVSQLVALLKRDVEEKHRNVSVVGEVSSFKQWRSGHCYFDIKDEAALLPAVIFKPHFARLQFAVKDGMEMVFTGRVSIYNANARLQMIVTAMEPLGQGALALAFEQLKEKLKSEGLFDARFKKPIKSFNQTVGLITSSHGAVLRDMVRILKSRMPKTDILFVPVRVQGAGAALEIKNAIEFLDGLGACDVIIVGRGGGSLEDLWAFNEEAVARAIFNAKTPIISAVGHETDTTISDFVADLRAATPTHAASMVVPRLADVEAELRKIIASLSLRHEANIRAFKLRLMHEKRRLKDPRVLLFRHWQVLDEAQKKLDITVSRRMREQMTRLRELERNLKNQAPLRKLRLKRETLVSMKQRLVAKNPASDMYRLAVKIDERKRHLADTMARRLNNCRQMQAQYATKLDALSPLRVLSRGYGVVEDDKSSSILSKAAQFSLGQTIRLRLEDGMIKARVIENDFLK